jgi:hypothetical protein
VSQLDGTLVMAVIGNISSEFDDLQNAGWLFSCFGLAMCVAQPLVGIQKMKYAEVDDLVR